LTAKLNGSMSECAGDSRVILSAAWSKIPLPCLTDLKTGVTANAYFFLAVLGASSMPFIKAFPCKEQKYWVEGLIDAIEFYGALPACIAPRTHNAPRFPEYLTPADGSAFGMFSKFYGISVLPVCLRGLPSNPDIALFETVSWPLRQIQDKVFYSLDELNDIIGRLLSRYVALPDARTGNSLRGVFLDRDKPLMRPLPEQRFSITDVTSRMVGDNCFVQYGGFHYSVPYQFCKRNVILHASESEIFIYDLNGVFIASHKRTGNTKYIMDPCHMPPKYKLFGYDVYTGEKYVEWAAHIGDNTRFVIELLLATADCEQLAFKTCMAILQLSKKFGNSRLESACKTAKLFSRVSYCAIKKFASQGSDFHGTKDLPTQRLTLNEYFQPSLVTGFIK